MWPSSSEDPNTAGSSTPADQTRFSLTYGYSSIPGSSPPPDESTFDPYREVYAAGSMGPFMGHLAGTASISSTSVTRSLAQPNEEDVYLERPKVDARALTMLSLRLTAAM